MAHVEVHSPNNGHERRYATETFDTTTTRDSAVQRSAKAVTGASVLEIVAGAAAIVLPILGLLDILPLTMAAITCIAIGAGFLLSGVAVSARWKDILSDLGPERRHGADIGGGLTAEFLGGAAGVALGILALLGIYPEILIPVAAIVFGGTLLFASAAQAELSSVGHDDVRSERATRGASRAMAGAEVLCGIAAIVLGILVLAGWTGGLAPIQLSLIAFLVVGAAMLLAGTTLGARMVSALRH